MGDKMKEYAGAIRNGKDHLQSTGDPGTRNYSVFKSLLFCFLFFPSHSSHSLNITRLSLVQGSWEETAAIMPTSHSENPFGDSKHSSLDSSSLHPAQLAAMDRQSQYSIPRSLLRGEKGRPDSFSRSNMVC